MAYSKITSEQYPISLVKGDDWNREITVNDASGNPFDFTGWTGKAEVRKSASGTSPVVITFDTSAATMTLTSGKITLIAAKATTDINPSSYVWDLQFVDADGLTRTLIKNGPFTITEDVTE